MSGRQMARARRNRSLQKNGTIPPGPRHLTPGHRKPIFGRQMARARRNRSLQKNGTVSSAGLGKNEELLGLNLPRRSEAAKGFRRIDEFLAGEGSEDASRHLRPRFQ